MHYITVLYVQTATTFCPPLIQTEKKIKFMIFVCSDGIYCMLVQKFPVKVKNYDFFPYTMNLKVELNFEVDENRKVAGCK